MQRFNFQQIFKSFTTGYKPLKCATCHVSYNHTMKNRYLGGVSIGIGFLIGGAIMLNLETNFIYRYLIGLSVGIICALVLISISINFLSFTRED